jgi:outer membrane biosynthesis protein TonB
MSRFSKKNMIAHVKQTQGSLEVSRILSQGWAHLANGMTVDEIEMVYPSVVIHPMWLEGAVLPPPPKVEPPPKVKKVKEPKTDRKVKVKVEPPPKPVAPPKPTPPPKPVVTYLPTDERKVYTELCQDLSYTVNGIKRLCNRTKLTSSDPIKKELLKLAHKIISQLTEVE